MSDLIGSHCGAWADDEFASLMIYRPKHMECGCATCFVGLANHTTWAAAS